MRRTDTARLFSPEPSFIRLLDSTYPRLNDNAVQFYGKDYSSKGAIFSEE